MKMLVSELIRELEIMKENVGDKPVNITCYYWDNHGGSLAVADDLEVTTDNSEIYINEIDKY